MKSLLGAFVVVTILGSTNSFAQDGLNVTAVVTFFMGGGRDVYSGVIDLSALKEDNMYECCGKEDGFYYKDRKNDYIYMLKIFRTDDGILKIWGGSSWKGKSALETSFVGVLAMPTTQGLGQISFYASAPVFYKITVWTYPTEKYLAEKILTKNDRELLCSLKTKDIAAKGFSMPLSYEFYNE